MVLRGSNGGIHRPARECRPSVNWKRNPIRWESRPSTSGLVPSGPRRDFRAPRSRSWIRLWARLSIKRSKPTKATQVDVIGFSTGSLVMLAYLSGEQNTPSPFQTTRQAQHSKGCRGSRFLWDLNIWTQGRDDLRGIDPLPFVRPVVHGRRPECFAEVGPFAGECNAVALQAGPGRSPGGGGYLGQAPTICGMATECPA